MYKLFLTLRYLRSRRIAYFAVAAVTLCVAMVLIVMSVMGGWLEQVKRRARGLLGDIILDNRHFSGFPLYQEFIDEVSRWPEIAKATPVIYTEGLLHFPQTRQMNKVNVVGIRLHDVYEVNAFKGGLYYERFYPGTTTLAEIRQPLLGRDFRVETRALPDGGAYLPLILPEPHQSALQRARAEQVRQTGGSLDDPDTVDTRMNALLRRLGEPIIPGVYDFNEVDELPGFAGDPQPGLIIGREMLAKRQSDGRYQRYENYPRGCTVILTLVAASSSGGVEPIKRVFRYVDDARTGIYEIDSQHVYCDFDLLQQLLQMQSAERVNPESGERIGTVPPRCHQIQIKLAANLTPADARTLCRRLDDTYHAYAQSERYDLDDQERRLISYVEALTWEQSQAHIIAPVEKEKMLVTILFAIISLVAVALVLCILYMIVLQKTRDIGIVKAIGGSSGGVATIFIFYGAAVGIVGSLLGTLLGTLFVHRINEFQDFLIRINPAWRVWDLQVYSFDRIPSDVDPFDAASVVLIAIAAATVGSLAAAWRAGTMQPVEAIRYE